MRTYVVLAALLLSGCVAVAPEPTPSPEPTGTVYDPMQEIVVDYSANQCREAFIVALVEPALAQKNLPKGYKTRDAQGLFGLPFASGRAALWLTGINCAQSSFALGGIDDGGFGVYVEAPNVAGERPAAKDHFYEFGRYTSKEETLRMLRAVGYNVHEGSVDVTVTPQAGGAHTGGSQVRNDEGAVVFTLGFTGPAQQPISGRARFWHEAENGTAYTDFVINTNVAQGSGSCTIRDLKIREKMGIESCGNTGAGLGFPPYKWESAFHWLPGVKAA